jgi:3-methyladenine DNA glycosylase AlkC
LSGAHHNRMISPRTKKCPTSRQSQRLGLSRLVQSHESRQSLPWLISDVRRKPKMSGAVVTKIQDIKELLSRGRVEPDAVFPELRRLAASDQWQTREVAATALVEISKRHPAAVLQVARRWAKDRDANVRRAASEGLRGLVKTDPEAVRPVIDTLRADPELYVKKSVANVLRNASGKHPDFVLGVCRRWGRSTDPHTRWIVNDGLRKLRSSRPRDVAALLA